MAGRLCACRAGCVCCWRVRLFFHECGCYGTNVVVTERCGDCLMGFCLGRKRRLERAQMRGRGSWRELV